MITVCETKVNVALLSNCIIHGCGSDDLYHSGTILILLTFFSNILDYKCSF